MPQSFGNQLSIKLLAILVSVISVSHLNAQTITFDPAQAGGNIDTAEVWIGGNEPDMEGENGIVETDAVLIIGNNLGAWTSADSYTYGGGSTLTVGSSAAIIANTTPTNLAGTNGTGDYGHQNAGMSTFNDATLLVNDDVFSNNSMMIFNEGSMAFVGDDFEANGNPAQANTEVSFITINGGTHQIGDRMGVQNGNMFETLGGSITSSRARLDAEGFWNVDCDALIRVMNGFDGPDGDGFAGTVNIASTWSGQWTNDFFSGNQWETLVTADDSTWNLNGTRITAASFATDFQVTNNGTTLSLVAPDAKPNDDVLKGDVDLSGTVTFLDINPFIMVLSSNGFQAEADCDCDGDVDFLDIQPFIDILAGN